MGPTAERVANNLRRLREARGMSLRMLSTELEKVGRTLSADAINKIENGRTLEPGSAEPKQIRRADVDDLVAFALVFNVSPLTLLLPATAGEEPAAITRRHKVTSRTAWQWGTGRGPALDWEPGEGVSLAEPGADPAIAAEAYEREQEFGRRQEQYSALALPVGLRRAAHNPFLRLVQQLEDLAGDIVGPRGDREDRARWARMALRRVEQIKLNLEEIAEVMAAGDGLEELKRQYPGMISHVQVAPDGTVTDVSEPRDRGGEDAP